MPRPLQVLFTAWLAFQLAACGGGSNAPGSSSGSAQSATFAPVPVVLAVVEPNAPALTGNTATDGLNWFNFRRQQIGLQGLARNSLLDAAAQGHSAYQQANNIITHIQMTGKPDFTGVTLADRLSQAGFRFMFPAFAYGEVISSVGNTQGAAAAEDLVSAIYHRFVIFEPMFKQAGAGAATVACKGAGACGATYFTTDLVTDNLDGGLGEGQFVIYPFDRQKNVLTMFNSDFETPDPVPNQDIVGYPVSVHADLTASVTVRSFTITPRVMPPVGPLITRLLSSATDPLTPASAAAIIPLAPLAGATTYDVSFSGMIDNVAVDRSWSFTTR